MLKITRAQMETLAQDGMTCMMVSDGYGRFMAMSFHFSLRQLHLSMGDGDLGSLYASLELPENFGVADTARVMSQVLKRWQLLVGGLSTSPRETMEVHEVLEEMVRCIREYLA